ncbi:hypothetical protein QTG56_24095 (plasmid) [Rossellomorea sp. AcN35-11]|nr:hypothetical protein [Rossellomorea aquimaris]WJV31721.1 hypothetical protein QTG56_24095 [Rossellomorea sp. AcN35-11]
MNKTVSIECKSCESDFLAITGTKEYRLQICHRCFMNGPIAKTREELNEEKLERFEKRTMKEIDEITIGLLISAVPISIIIYIFVI